VPFQEYPATLKEKYGDRIELVETARDIRSTVLQLLTDMDDDEWIYWAIDDKYLISINEPATNNVLEWLYSIQEDDIQGIMFCRCRKLLDDRNLRPGTNVSDLHGNQFIERKNYYHCWVHQFFRVGVLRRLFLGFPERHFTAVEMDAFTGQRENLEVKEFEEWERMYVSTDNMAIFGESTTGGKITKNCAKSFRRVGLAIPDWCELSGDRMVIGDMPMLSRVKDPFFH